MYCGVSLSSRLRSEKGTVIQMGGVLLYKFEVHSAFQNDYIHIF